MNFFENIPNFNGPLPPNFNPPIPNNNINFKIQELENRIKKLELRISRLESEKFNNSYIEPDTSLYMI
ncbi:MAG: hypothetical protein IJE89_02060 [Bacilli bacterium]|nr:hypothetical protein [Bacilli bacterium]